MAVLLLSLLACGSEADSPHFDLSSLELLDDQSQSVTLADLADRTLVINFWASWCAPCVEELPALQDMNQQLNQDRYRLLLVSVDAEPDKARQQLADLQIGLPAYFDSSMAVANGELAIQGYPSTLVIDSEGRLLERVVGARDWSDPEVWQKILP